MQLQNDTVYLARVPVDSNVGTAEQYRALARAALDPLELDLPTDGTIVLKANATVLFPADKRIITHPQFLAGLVGHLQLRKLLTDDDPSPADVDRRVDLAVEKFLRSYAAG